MKAESAEKKALRLAREQKQREKLLREQNRKPWKNYALYLGYLIVILTVIYIVDEIASAMNGTMQPLMIFDFFKVPGNNTDTAEYRNGATLMMALTMSSLLFMFLTPFYKALADKFGRKVFLIINTTTMGLGLFICFLAPHWAVYVLGILIVQFVQTNDVQVIYIMETAPEKHRALLCNLTKAIALISVALIGVLRNIFYKPDVPSSWHMVFLIPAIVGIVVGLACIFLIHETPVFVKNRLEYLQMSDAERAKRAAKEKQKDANAQGGVGAALRYIFSSKQLKRLCLAGFVFMIATGITSQYSTILERGEDLGTLTENSVDKVLIIYPFVWGVVTFICGYLSDLLGRKKSSILFNIIAVVSVVIFGLGVNLGWPVWLIACGYGLFLGTLWSVSDTLCLVMPAESSPTAMRASVMGTTSLLIGIGMALSQGIYMVAINIFQGQSFAWFSMGISALFLIASTFLLLRTSETKDANLYTVGDE